MSTEEMNVSKSKLKREARKQEVKAEKAKVATGAILTWVFGIVIAAIVIGVIGMGIYKSLDKVVASSEFSKYLEADGSIKGADLNSVTDLSLESHVIALSEVEYTDEEVDSDVSSALSKLSAYSDDSSLTVADGDTINLDYVGSVDGVEFDGGSTGGSGTTLTIGSGSYIDNFEEQLIGAHPGDSVTVNVTFPEDYSSTELAGKAAVFECVVNSILTTPELTDELVAENFTSYNVSTVDELRAYFKNYGYETNVKEYITNYISENANASKLPSAYTKHERSVIAYMDEQNYEYYSQILAMYYGTSPYSSIYDFVGVSEDEYQDQLKERAESQTALDMTYEQIFKNNNLSIDEESYNASLENYGEESVTMYGEAYFKQLAMKEAVVNYLLETMTVQ